MNRKMNSLQSGFVRATTAAIMVVTALTLGLADKAHANTAAGTQINNTVQVSFAEGTVAPVSVSVTVKLISSVAWGTPSPATRTVYSGTAITGGYTVTLTNKGNGKDTFTITDGTTQSTGNLSSVSGVTISPAAPVLFATVSKAAGVYDGTTNTTIPVGYLDTTALTAGTTKVVIGATEYTVAAGSTASQLVVAGDATADANGFGVQIGERVTITYNATAGSLSGGTATGDHNHKLTASDDTGGGVNSDGNPSVSVDSGAFTTTVNGGTVTVEKYVRNATAAMVGATPLQFPAGTGPTYYKTGIKGNPPNGVNPGDTLEYLIVLTGGASAGVSNVKLEDTIATDFVTLDTATISLDQDGDEAFDRQIGVASETVAADAGNAGAIVYSAPKITVYAGTGGNDLAPLGGSIAANGKSYVKYSVTIK